MGSYTDARISDALLELLGQRAAGATICPSEVARALSPDAWRPLMSRVRTAARRLAAAGQVEIRQRGAAIDPAAPFTGPIRIGFPASR